MNTCPCVRRPIPRRPTCGEQRSLKRNSGEELAELTEIYVQRGLSPDLAAQVASQLTHHDALDAHARDELGILLHNRARPVQAAVASAACSRAARRAPGGGGGYADRTVDLDRDGCVHRLSGRAGGAGRRRRRRAQGAALRVTILGALAMAVTAGVGAVFGVAV